MSVLLRIASTVTGANICSNEVTITEREVTLIEYSFLQGF